jgi:hypothetical protein
METKGKYAALGDQPEQGQSKKAFILDIDSYKKIDPREYFITTGEATVKIEVLLNDIKDLTKELKNLQKELIRTKDESDYLETCWEGGNLVIKKKEKRSRSKNNEPVKAKTKSK